jgi:hypothetical protein
VPAAPVLDPAPVKNDKLPTAPSAPILFKPVSDHTWDDAEFRVAAMSIVLKCADMNSVGRPPAVAGMWARAIYKEFFRQADLEQDLGIPVTPVFQRDNVVICEAQVSRPRGIWTAQHACRLPAFRSCAMTETQICGSESSYSQWPHKRHR